MAETKTGKSKTKPVSVTRDPLSRATEELRRGKPPLMPKWREDNDGQTS